MTKNNTKKNNLIDNLDKTIEELEQKIKETNDFLSRYDNESLKPTSFWPIVAIVLAGYIFALIIFYVNNIVA